MVTNNGEKKNFNETLSHEKKNKWLKAMQKEIRALYENGTFELRKLPKSKKALNNKWAFRLKIKKKKNNYSQLRYKAISVRKRVLI